MWCGLFKRVWNSFRIHKLFIFIINIMHVLIFVKLHEKFSVNDTWKRLGKRTSHNIKCETQDQPDAIPSRKNFPLILGIKSGACTCLTSALLWIFILTLYLLTSNFIIIITILHQGFAKWPSLPLILLPYIRKALNLQRFALASNWSRWAYRPVHQTVQVCVCVFLPFSPFSLPSFPTQDSI